MQLKKESIVEQDLVLVHVEEKPGFFARVEAIRPDVKRGWWQVKFLALQVPVQLITWIIDDNQIRGEDFTMGGVPIRIEKVLPPPDPEPSAEPVPPEESGREDRQSGGAVVVSLTDRKPKKGD